MYEAALALYERFLPLVYEHLESSPFSKIAFTVGGGFLPQTPAPAWRTVGNLSPSRRLRGLMHQRAAAYTPLQLPRCCTTRAAVVLPYRHALISVQ